MLAARQFAGVRNRDLVCYDIDNAGQVEEYVRPPVCPLQVAEVTDEVFLAAWTCVRAGAVEAPGHVFERAVTRADWDMTWSVISDLTEDLLGAPD